MMARWGEIRRLRAEAGFSSTPVRMEVRDVTAATAGAQADFGAADGQADAAATASMAVPALYPHLHALAKLVLHMREVCSETDDVAMGLVTAAETLLARIQVCCNGIVHVWLLIYLSVFRTGSAGSEPATAVAACRPASHWMPSRRTRCCRMP